MERTSHLTCEECGSTEKIGNTEGWIKTLCEKCGKSNKSWYPIKLISTGNHTKITNLNSNNKL